MTRARRSLIAAVVGFAVGGLLLTRLPAAYVELDLVGRRLGFDWLPQTRPEHEAKPGAMAGTVVDGHWRVQQVAPGTYALGEPADAPDNYEYLLVGQSRALLIDAGATARDIRPVVSLLTALPVLVAPTHLHYDHTNGLANFNGIGLIDLPATRALAHDGTVHVGRYDVIGAAADVKVTEWLPANGFIDLGGRRVQLLSTPGHTRTSASFYDPVARLLFAGDLLYPGSLYAFMVDSSLADYEATSARLLGQLPADTRIYAAHCCRNDTVAGAPWLGMNDLADVHRAVEAIRTGHAAASGLLLKRFPVNARMDLLTFYPLDNR